MKRGLLYYPMYVNDFDDDTLTISLAAVGVYLLALNESWKRGGIPDDPSELARLIRRRPADVRRVWPELVRFWVPAASDGMLVNPRQEKERVIALDKSSKARESALLKHGKSDANARANAPPKASANGDAQPVLSKIQDTEKERIHPSDGDGMDPFRDEFLGHLLDAKLANVPLDLSQKVCDRARKHGVTSARAAAVFMEIYYRAHKQRVTGDGVGYLLTSFENEIKPKPVQPAVTVAAVAERKRL